MWIRATLCISLLGAIGCGQKVDFKLHLKPGDIRIVHMATTTSTVGGKGSDYGQSLDAKYRFEIQDVNSNGTAQVKATIEAFDPVVYERSNGKPNLAVNAISGCLGATCNLIRGQSFTCMVAPDGRVSNVQGMAAILTQASNGIKLPPEYSDEKAKERVHAKLARYFSDTWVEGFLTESFYIFPKRPVRVGDTWDSEENSTDENEIMENPLKCTGKVVFTKTQNGIASFEEAETIVGDDAKLPPRPDLFVRLRNIKGSESISTEVDIASGWIVRSVYKEGVDANVVSVRGVAAPAGRDVTVTFETKGLVESFDAR